MDKKKLSTKILRYAKKIKAVRYLGNECKNCGENNLFKLTFHHRKRNEKEFKFNDYKWSSWSVLKKELDKCDLLCQNCHRELHYELGNEEDVRRKDKLIYLEYSSSSCVKCGYAKSPSALTFHHKNPMDKKFSIGSLSERMVSIFDLDNIIKSEIDKCEVLCSNCHVLEHSDLDFYEKYKKEIYNKSFTYKERTTKIDRELIKNMYFDRKMKQIEISKKLGCSKGTISDIIKEIKLNEK